MRRKVTGAQNISRMCLVCGVENTCGLQARFLELEGGELAGVFQPRAEHQSYPGRLHGGISAAILDETIGRAITIVHPDTWGVTVELTLRFRQAVPLDREVTAVGRITRDTRRLFEGTGEIVLADGSVAVEAAGKYLKMPLEEITEAGLDGREWFADARERPSDLEM
jgi:acyl-coenzyme A thioesterase PaaI-like protein